MTLTRRAIQSFRDEIDQLREARLIPVLLIPLLFVVVWMVECVQKYAGRNPDPQFWALIALVVTVYGGFEIFRLRPGLRQVRPTERGARGVAKVLNRVKKKGFVAFHNLTGENSNIDHVIVGPTGIYAIKIKARMGRGTIDYCDENELIFGGRISDNRPLAQVRSAAYTLHGQLQGSLPGYAVKPLLVFFGNWRVHRGAGDFDVDVVTGDQLEDYLDRQQPELTSNEIAHICAQLEQPARS